MNTDETYMCIQLHTSWEQLPGCKHRIINGADGDQLKIDNDFKELFSQYKITSVHHTLTPNYSKGHFYSNDQAMNGAQTGSFDRNIPNYEMFVLPGNWIAGAEEDNASLHTKSGLEIDAWLNSTNRKSRRIIPSKTQRFQCNNPTVVKYDAITSHQHHGYAATTKMGAAGYYNTNPDDTPSDKMGFGADAQAIANGPNPLGFRLSTEVGFMCRSTPKDIMIDHIPGSTA